MKLFFRSSVVLVLLVLILGCSGGERKETPPATGAARTSQPVAAVPSTSSEQTTAQIVQFVKQVESNLLALLSAREKTAFLMGTHNTHDTQVLSEQSAKAVLDYLAQVSPLAAQYAADVSLPLPPDVRRKLYILLTFDATPPPAEPQQRAQLAEVSTKLQSMDSSAKYCPTDPASALLTMGGKKKGPVEKICFDQKQLIGILADPKNQTSAKLPVLQEAWLGWHNLAAPMRDPYASFVDLGNAGARNLGYADLGMLWRSGYDMPPEAFAEEIERLWGQLKPFYEKLHCATRKRLREHYGANVVAEKGPIPAHLMGNLWAQSWEAIAPILMPKQAKTSIDLDAILKKQAGQQVIAELKRKPGGRTLRTDQYTDILRMAADAQKERQVIARWMLGMGEQFFVSLGFPKLPETFWQRSMIVQPLDRTVQCHASAETMDLAGDVRLKMCITPTAADFFTIHHELGHDYYYLAYQTLDLLFRNSANDGFHEAIGDTLQLSALPDSYLQQVGLIKNAPPADAQMEVQKLLDSALNRFAFLPFGKVVDQWRWEVFSGKTKPSEYNKRWWELVTQYQGIRPPVERTEKDFDPGSKHHVPANVPYARYFLARVLQFQFHRALCKAAGHQGPLHQCSIYGNKAAGEKLQAVLAMGQSKPWQEALQALTGEASMDAGAMLEYYKPLTAWLDKETAGQTCGW